MAVETNAPKIVIALLALSTASLIFMVLRFFCKGRYSKQFGWDDYIVAFSWVCRARGPRTPEITARLQQFHLTTSSSASSSTRP